MPQASKVSPPLPLPFGFALLPSQLPGSQLTPLLHTTLNGLPVYLTLSPSHVPHLSLLPVLLALKVPTTPLSLLSEYGLSPAQYSLDLEGLAPWADLWVPLETARPLLRDLGAGRLFWDTRGRGMLGKVADAVSWEEAGGWYHNWLPAKSHLPSSSYSFDSLLSRTWTFTELIPDDRCVFTPAGKQRMARLVSDGLEADHSNLRRGVWGPVWTYLLRWTVQSWQQYRLSPSPFPRPRHNRHRRVLYPTVELLNSLPLIFGPLASTSIPISPSDFDRILPANTTVSPRAIFTLVRQLTLAIIAYIVSLFPALSRLVPLSWGLDKQSADKQWLARINLVFCALVSDVVLGIWKLRRDNDRLRTVLHGQGETLPADIVMSADKMPTERSSCSSSASSAEELDVILELEKKRGGSPPPISGSGRKTKSSKSSKSSKSGRRVNRPVSARVRPREQVVKPAKTDKEAEPPSPTRESESDEPPARPPAPRSRRAQISRVVETPSSLSSVDEEHSHPHREDGPSRRSSDKSMVLNEANERSVDEAEPKSESDTVPKTEATTEHQEADTGDKLGEEMDMGEPRDTVPTEKEPPAPRIHPWPTGIISLLAVIAAFIVLQQSGPRY